jgi:hypothetical protein
LGDLEPMARLGMSRLLAEEDGVEEVGNAVPGGAIVSEAARLAPDAVVLRLDDRELAGLIQATVPGTKIILWAGDETEMQILDPGGRSLRRVMTEGPGALLNELAMSEPGRGGV